MYAIRKKHDDGRGELLTVNEMAIRTGLSEWTIHYRLKHGISIYAPLRFGQGRPLARIVVDGVETTYEALAKQHGITVCAARQRYLKSREPPKPRVPRQSAREYRDTIGGEEIIDRITPFEEDDKCWYVTACHPDGITLEEVGTLINCTRERVRQIEATALRKLAALGIRHRDLVLMRESGERMTELREKHSAYDNPALGGVHHLVSPTALPNGRRRAS